MIINSFVSELLTNNYIVDCLIYCFMYFSVGIVIIFPIWFFWRLIGGK